jgi:hypothetical protein
LPPKPKSLKLIAGSVTWQQVSQRLSVDQLNVLDGKNWAENDVDTDESDQLRVTRSSAVQVKETARSMSVSDICKVFESKSTSPVQSTYKGARQASSLISLTQPEVTEEPAFPVGLVQQRKLAFTERPHLSFKARPEVVEPTSECLLPVSAPVLIATSTVNVAPTIGSMSSTRLEELVELDEGVASIETNSNDWIVRLQQQARQCLEDDPVARDWALHVIALKRESAKTGSIGITLAGGVDYECKHITVRERERERITTLCLLLLTRFFRCSIVFLISLRLDSQDNKR